MGKKKKKRADTSSSSGGGLFDSSDSSSSTSSSDDGGGGGKKLNSGFGSTKRTGSKQTVGERGSKKRANTNPQQKILAGPPGQKKQGGNSTKNDGTKNQSYREWSDQYNAWDYVVDDDTLLNALGFGGNASDSSASTVFKKGQPRPQPKLRSRKGKPMAKSKGSKNDISGENEADSNMKRAGSKSKKANKNQYSKAESSNIQKSENRLFTPGSQAKENSDSTLDPWAAWTGSYIGDVTGVGSNDENNNAGKDEVLRQRTFGSNNGKKNDNNNNNSDSDNSSDISSSLTDTTSFSNQYDFDTGQNLSSNPKNNNSKNRNDTKSKNFVRPFSKLPWAQKVWFGIGSVILLGIAISCVVCERSKPVEEKEEEVATEVIVKGSGASPACIGCSISLAFLCVLGGFAMAYVQGWLNPCLERTGCCPPSEEDEKEDENSQHAQEIALIKRWAQMEQNKARLHGFHYDGNNGFFDVPLELKEDFECWTPKLREERCKGREDSDEICYCPVFVPSRKVLKEWREKMNANNSSSENANPASLVPTATKEDKLPLQFEMQSNTSEIWYPVQYRDRLGVGANHLMNEMLRKCMSKLSKDCMVFDLHRKITERDGLGVAEVREVNLIDMTVKWKTGNNRELLRVHPRGKNALDHGIWQLAWETQELGVFDRYWMPIAQLLLSKLRLWLISGRNSKEFAIFNGTPNSTVHQDFKPNEASTEEKLILEKNPSWPLDGHKWTFDPELSWNGQRWMAQWNQERATAGRHMMLKPVLLVDLWAEVKSEGEGETDVDFCLPSDTKMIPVEKACFCRENNDGQTPQSMGLGKTSICRAPNFCNACTDPAVLVEHKEVEILLDDEDFNLLSDKSYQLGSRASDKTGFFADPGSYPQITQPGTKATDKVLTHAFKLSSSSKPANYELPQGARLKLTTKRTGLRKSPKKNLVVLAQGSERCEKFNCDLNLKWKPHAEEYVNLTRFFIIRLKMTKPFLAKKYFLKKSPIIKKSCYFLRRKGPEFTRLITLQDGTQVERAVHEVDWYRHQQFKQSRLKLPKSAIPVPVVTPSSPLTTGDDEASDAEERSNATDMSDDEVMLPATPARQNTGDDDGSADVEGEGKRVRFNIDRQSSYSPFSHDRRMSTMYGVIRDSTVRDSTVPWLNGGV